MAIVAFVGYYNTMAAPRRIQKRGGSLSVTLPTEICDAMNLKFGDCLIFVLQSDQWCGITKVDLEKRPDLKDLSDTSLSKISND